MKTAGRRLAVGGIALVALVGAVPASACGGDTSGPVVERGRSPGGQVWTQRACPNRTSPELLVDLYLPQRDGEDVGGGFGAPAPSHKLPLILGETRNRVGPSAERELDGVAIRLVTRVKIEFATGPPLVVATRPAPVLARRTHAYLRPLRFFVVFFAGARRAKSAVALSATGRVLANSPVA